MQVLILGVSAAAVASLSLLFGPAPEARVVPLESATLEQAVQRQAPVLARIHVEIPPQSLATYVNLASEIVHARVVSSRVERPSDAFPRTVYEVEVLSAIKGSSSGSLEVAVGGAEFPDGAYLVEHAPRFAVGEEAVLFLSHDLTTGMSGILGLEYGVYRVSRSNGRSVVGGEHAGAEPVDDFLARAGDLWTPIERR